MTIKRLSEFVGRKIGSNWVVKSNVCAVEAGEQNTGCNSRERNQIKGLSSA